jgi:DNA replication protein DnaC
MNAPAASTLSSRLDYLRLSHVAENYDALAKQAAEKHWSHVEYLEHLLEGEYQLRQHRAVERRIVAARFGAIKTLDSFEWDWPKKINEAQVRHIFRLGFVAQKSNVIFMGRCGTGKSHLAAALGYHACQHGHSVLFTSAIDALNRLVAAKAAHRLRAEFRRYLAPSILVCDEIGYLPLDKVGADLVFQLISQRYEQGSLVLTTNSEYKRWSAIFNNDAGLTSAILDRILHRAETVVIEGKSYRMKGQPDPVS